MSVRYLINPFTVAGDIIDVVSSSEATNTTGSSIIQIPDGVAIHTSPTDVATLLTAKYDGLLASYAGYTQIAADPCQDLTYVDVPNCDKFLGSGGFVHHCLLPNGVFTSAAVALGSTPTTCVVVWEEASVSVTDDTDALVTQAYEPLSGNMTAMVSFNGGSTFISATNGGVTNIPLADQGASFVIQLTNGIERTYLGSWAVVY